MGQLVEKVKSLAAERDTLREELLGLTAQLEQAGKQQETTDKIKEKAKKAVDIAVQLLGEARART